MVTFAIKPFKDSVLCDVSPLDCVDLLLGLPYQHSQKAIYMAHTHYYCINKDGHTYLLSLAPPKSKNKQENHAHV